MSSSPSVSVTAIQPGPASPFSFTTSNRSHCHTRGCRLSTMMKGTVVQRIHHIGTAGTSVLERVRALSHAQWPAADQYCTKCPGRCTITQHTTLPPNILIAVQRTGAQECLPVNKYVPTCVLLRKSQCISRQDAIVRPEGHIEDQLLAEGAHVVYEGEGETGDQSIVPPQHLLHRKLANTRNNCYASAVLQLLAADNRLHDALTAGLGRLISRDTLPSRLLLYTVGILRHLLTGSRVLAAEEVTAYLDVLAEYLSTDPVEGEPRAFGDGHHHCPVELLSTLLQKLEEEAGLEPCPPRVNTDYTFGTPSEEWREKMCERLDVEFQGMRVAHTLSPRALPRTLNPHEDDLLDVAADGSCFFRCISTLLCGSESAHVDIRHAIRQEMYEGYSTYKRIYGGTLEEFEQHLKDMVRTNGGVEVFATQAEVTACATYLGLPIHVHKAETGMWHVSEPLYPSAFQSQDQEEMRGIYLHLDNSHYKLVTDMRTTTGEDAFELIGAVCYHAHREHYVALVKEGAAWYKFDDDKIVEVTEEAALAHAANTATLLHYARHVEDEEKEQEEQGDDPPAKKPKTA